MMTAAKPNKLSGAKSFALCLAVALVFFSVFHWLSATYTGQPPLWTADSQSMQPMAHDQLNHGALQINVGTNRTAGNRIGDIIAVRAEFITDRKTKLDFSTVQDGQLAVDYSNYNYSGSTPTPDFELVQPPTISQTKRDGHIVYQVDLLVRSWKVSDTVSFTFSFAYSATSSKGIYWIEDRTPPLIMETSRSAQPGDQFDLGDRSAKKPAPAPLATPLGLLGSGILVILLAGALINLADRRNKTSSEPTPAQKAWAVFDDVYQRAGSSWTEAHFLAIATALRQYLEVFHAGIESQTLEQLRQRQDLHNKPLTISVFQLLDDALYAKKIPDGTTLSKLHRSLELLVPQAPPAATEGRSR